MLEIAMCIAKRILCKKFECKDGIITLVHLGYL